jgi:hypothetical protein
MTNRKSKACWFISTTGCRPFAMLGSVLTHDEALAAARLIWPQAEVA